MKHAIFPISVDSELFSSENTTRALAADPSEFSCLTFLVADRIQVYNDIAKKEGDIDAILSLDWSGDYRRDFEQRRRWLTKLREKLPAKSHAQRWRVMGIDDAADRLSYVALRSVWLLYRFDPGFADDVDAAAMDFAHRRDLQKTDLLRDMSLAYLLEEIAINIRLRVVRAIFDEYYMGDTLPMLPKLYDGCYAKSAEELMGRPKRPKGTFRFWHWRNDRWLLCGAQEPYKSLRLVS